MPKSIAEILGSDVLTEDAKTELQEAFDARLTEEREKITAEIREDFANRYEVEKSELVEAMDVMLKDALKSEISEFAEDKSRLAEDRVRYKKAIKEHAKMLNTFINEVLTKEIRELREDRNAQKANFKGLEEFMIRQLTKELNEFHNDKRSLVEQKIKMIREGKKVIEEARKGFVKKSAGNLQQIIEGVLRKELTNLREDIQVAKENEFGRKIFETFASEFMTSTLSESTQVSKLAKEIINLKGQISEAEETISSKDEALNEAKRNTRIAKDLLERKTIMSEMLSPLNKTQKELMSTLLESVKTSQLRTAYKKYLPSVLSENASEKNSKKTLKENTQRDSRREINGDKLKKDAQTEFGGSADY